MLQIEAAALRDAVIPWPRLRPASGLLALLVLSNLGSFAVRAGFGSGRPLINLDFLIIPAICAVLGLRTGALAYVILVLIDLLVFLAPVFHFDALQALALARYAGSLNLTAPHLPLGLLALAGLVIACGVLTISCSFRRVRLVHAACALFLGVVLVAVDVFGNTGGWQQWHRHDQPDLMRLPMNIATSGIYSIARDTQLYWEGRKVGPWKSVPSATRMALGVPGTSFRHASVQGRNFALIIVESWGQRVDPLEADRLVQPLWLPEVLRAYEVRQGTVPFEGSTTAAELRENCGVTYQFQWVLGGQKRTECLPAALEAQGFDVLGIHGFFGSFFDRTRWWPNIGITHSAFLESLQSESLPLCGHLFRGICDERLIEKAGGELAKPGRHAVYLLTLNSHLPLSPERQDFEAARAQRDSNPALVVYSRQLRAVFQALARQAARQDVRDTHFVIVGDHSPPFVDYDAARLFRQDVVPYIELRPRTHSGSRSVGSISETARN